jgi:hypothetical protein
MIFREAGLSISERRSCASKGMIRKSGYRFSEKIMLKQDVQQQSGRWA